MMSNKWILKFRNLMHKLVMEYAPRSIQIKIMSCEEVTRIMASEIHLSWTKKFWFGMHKFACSCCSSYQAQFDIIKMKSQSLNKQSLTEDQKTRIANSKKDILNKFSNK